MFFVLVAIVYGIFTGLSRTGIEWAGLTGIVLSAGLTLIIGTYFRFVARRLDTRPEDYEDAEISDGAGDLGLLQPGQLLADPAGRRRHAFAAISLAFFQPWMIAVAVVLILAAVGRPGVRVPHRSREALSEFILHSGRHTFGCGARRRRRPLPES